MARWWRALVKFFTSMVARVRVRASQLDPILSACYFSARRSLVRLVSPAGGFPVFECLLEFLLRSAFEMGL
jgi:hypothetical protein